MHTLLKEVLDELAWISIKTIDGPARLHALEAENKLLIYIKELEMQRELERGVTKK